MWKNDVLKSRCLRNKIMDNFDHTILSLLEADGRQSYVGLAEQVGLSKTPCWARVQALEKDGVIRGYRAVLEPSALGLGLTAFVQVSIEFGSHTAFEAAALAHPAIIECYTTAGDGDYLLKVATSDVEQLDSLLREDLCRLPGVQRFSTKICLKTIKDGGPLTRTAEFARRARR
jgi:Lrp/AsnC family leucine-responsive transcriptional regulator